MDTRISRVVIYHKGLIPIKSHDPLITWSCEITWQTKIIITQLTEWFMVTKLCSMGTYLDGFLTIKSHDPLITKQLYLHYNSAYGHCRMLTYLEGFITIKSYNILLDHVTNESLYISTTRLAMATKLGRMVTYLEGLLTLK